ncbi:MAG: IS200/IS605 family transposase [Chloroflexi bacterium]|nr:IS200/IS605 family transposase [Chloroflexota bacterium]
MRSSQTALFVHLVWATWDRLPLLNDDLRRPIYRAIEAKCLERGARVIALGGVADHVHLLVELPATLAVADLVKHVKGASAHLATHHLAPGEMFKWQGGYGAFSVSPRQCTEVRDYIGAQAAHHAAGALVPAWEPHMTDTDALDGTEQPA